MGYWTMVLSEYLDLRCILREQGEPVVTVRSAVEALECLEHWAPARLVVDTGVPGVEHVVARVRTYLPDVRLESYDEAVGQVLAVAS